MSTAVMDRCVRIDPPVAADERTMAAAYLDYQRETLLCKLAGLRDEQLTWRLAPSTLSLIGIVKHLTIVELVWFRERFAGEVVGPDQEPRQADDDFVVLPGETCASIIAGYQAEVARSRTIIAAHGLDTRAKRPNPRRGPDLTLRWIMFHMIEETARHNGHADLIREAIDGEVGE